MNYFKFSTGFLQVFTTCRNIVVYLKSCSGGRRQHVVRTSVHVARTSRGVSSGGASTGWQKTCRKLIKNRQKTENHSFDGVAILMDFRFVENRQKTHVAQNSIQFSTDLRFVENRQNAHCFFQCFPVFESEMCPKMQISKTGKNSIQFLCGTK